MLPGEVDGQHDALGLPIEFGEFAAGLVQDWLDDADRHNDDRFAIDALAMVEVCSKMVGNFAVFRAEAIDGLPNTPKLEGKELDQFVQRIAFFAWLAGRHFEQYLHRRMELELEREQAAKERRVRALPKALAARSMKTQARHAEFRKLAEIVITEKLRRSPRSPVKAASVIRDMLTKPIVESTSGEPIVHPNPKASTTTLEKIVTREFVLSVTNRWQAKRMPDGVLPQHRGQLEANR